MIAIVKLLGGWRATVFAVLAVAALVACLIFWGRLGHALVRADAAESRAKALAGEVAALKEAGKRDDQSADATKAARDAAAKRQPEQQARAAKVKGYADSAPDRCVGSPDIVRELREGTDRVRSSENRLRGNGRPEGAPAGAAEH